MKKKIFAIVVGTLALECAAFVPAAKAQGPLYDTVIVKIPYTVQVRDKVLNPGRYIIKELQTQHQSQVLDIYSDNGSKGSCVGLLGWPQSLPSKKCQGPSGLVYELSVITMRAYSLETPDQTTVTLHQFGKNFYFDRIMIEGKNYGYEFPLPSAAKQRQRELQLISLAAKYQPQPAPAPQAIAQAAPPPEEAPAPPPEEAAPAPAPPQAHRELPKTSGDWLMMLLSGGFLSGAGLLLRRRRLG
jgi:LPXTG-motif cell wall-anchored protein